MTWSEQRAVMEAEVIDEVKPRKTVKRGKKSTSSTQPFSRLWRFRGQCLCR